MALRRNDEVIRRDPSKDTPLYTAFRNNNGKIEVLDRIETQVNGVTKYIYFRANNITPAVQNMKIELQALVTSLRPIVLTTQMLTDMANAATYTGANGNGTVILSAPNGINIGITNNNLLSNGDTSHIVLTPQDGFTITGPREFDVVIPAGSFTPPVKTVDMTPAIWQDIESKMVYTGNEGSGIALGMSNSDYAITVNPADHLASGDTIQLTATPVGQTVLSGALQQMITIPANSFTDIKDETWASIVAKFEPTLNYNGYDGSGRIGGTIRIPAGVARIRPTSGLSNGDTLTAYIVLNPGYSIDGHTASEGQFVGTFVIPANRLPIGPATVIGDNLPRNSILRTLLFSGYQGSGKIFARIYKEFSYTFTPSTGIGNGDVITINVAANPGYIYNGPASFTYTVPAGTFADNTVRPQAVTDTIFAIPNRIGSGRLDGGVSAKANSNWISGGLNEFRDDVQTSDPLDPKHLVVYKGVRHIDEYAFYTAIFTSLDLPDGLLDIDPNTFTFSKLTSLVIPDSVTGIGESAFQHSKLTSLVIPNSVTTIGDFAFYDIANAPTTTVSMPSRFNTLAEKGRLFGKGSDGRGIGDWDQISFTWT